MRKLIPVIAFLFLFSLATPAFGWYQIPAYQYGCDDNGVQAKKVRGDTVVTDLTREWYIGTVVLNGKEATPKYLGVSYSSEQGDCHKVKYRVPGTTVPTVFTEYDINGEWLGDSYWNRPLR